jgi:phage-related minor tail protein
MEDFMDDVSAFTNDFEFEIEKTNQIIKDMAVNVDAEMQKAAASFQLPKTPLEELKEKAQDTFGAMQDIGVKSINRLEDSIMGVIDGTKSLKDAFADMATSILNDLIRMQIQQSITGPLSGFLSQGLGSLFSGGGATFTSGFAGAPALGFADGGVTSSRRPYMVGEKGPEMFVPNMTGRVVPNNALGGESSSIVVNQTINIETGVSQTVRAEIKQLMPQISEATKAAVLDARRRGGKFANAFA